MGIKLNKINIEGIRGTIGLLDLELNQRSIVLYGDNGTGKSSLSDSIEWFFTDKVSHLASTEIDTKDALRNSKINDEDSSYVKIEFTDAKLNATRSLIRKKDKLISNITNSETDFKSYLTVTEGQENIILRHQYLRDFIDKTKGDKLKALSDIIGFSEVQKKKEVLQKSFNWTKLEIKKQNFEGQTATQKKTLIEKLGAAISQEKDFLEKINEVIQPFKLGIEVKNVSEIDKVLEKLNKTGNNKLNEELVFLNKLNQLLSTLKLEVPLFEKEYNSYYQEFIKIVADVQSIMQTFLTKLLQSGEAVLAKRYHKEENCPLCLQPKSIEELRNEIAGRLKEMDASSKKKQVFDESKELISGIAQERLKRIDQVLAESLIQQDQNSHLKSALESIRTKVEEYEKASKIKVTSGEGIPNNSTIAIVVEDFSIQTKIDARIKEIQDIFKKDNSSIIFSNISASKDAFLEIKNIEKKKAYFEKQQSSLSIIYNAFVSKQKEGLDNFVTTFSGRINELYQYMNPHEPFEEIMITTLGEVLLLNISIMAIGYGHLKNTLVNRI